MDRIIKAYAVNNLCYKTARRMTPKGIVVHSTGANNPNLKRYVDAPNEVGINSRGNHWNVSEPGGRKVCVHAFIGYDKNGQVKVAEILPLNICCWGVGQGKKGSYNSDPAYIQFEICEGDLTDRDYYRKAFGVATEYCAALCKQYGIAVSNIVGHCEAYARGYGSNHSDPEHWMKKHGETMEDFRRAVSAILKTKEGIRENENETAPETAIFRDGDLVSIADHATYYSGKEVPKWVKSQKWYVKGEPKGDRVVIDKNESGTSSICSPIHKKFLQPALRKSKLPYLVKVTTNSLNIRKGAGSNTAKVGVITNKGTYTIVEEKQGVGASGWGKLKSGAGWISLDYVTIV